MTGPEPELLWSPLNRSSEQGGKRLTVSIVRLATERGWYPRSGQRSRHINVWHDQFETDRHADAAFRHALTEDRFEAFIDKD